MGGACDGRLRRRVVAPEPVDEAVPPLALSVSRLGFRVRFLAPSTARPTPSSHTLDPDPRPKTLDPNHDNPRDRKSQPRTPEGMTHVCAYARMVTQPTRVTHLFVSEIEDRSRPARRVGEGGECVCVEGGRAREREGPPEILGKATWLNRPRAYHRAMTPNPTPLT